MNTMWEAKLSGEDTGEGEGFGCDHVVGPIHGGGLDAHRATSGQLDPDVCSLFEDSCWDALRYLSVATF